jgi:protein TonB
MPIRRYDWQSDSLENCMLTPIFVILTGVSLTCSDANVAEEAPSAATEVLPEARMLEPRAFLERMQGNFPMVNIPREIKGGVSIRVRVNAIGRVENCTVVESSGELIIDQWACRSLTRYARFEPSRDAQGNPIESQWSNTISLCIPD